MKSRCTLCSWEKLIMRVTGIQANRFALLWCCQWAEWECTHASICGCICVFCVILINVASQQKAFLCTCHFRTSEVCVCVFGSHKPIVWCSLSLIWAGVHDWRGWGQQSPSISVYTHAAYQCRAMAGALQVLLNAVFLFRRLLALVNDQVGRRLCVSLLTHFGWLVCVV